MKIPSSVWRARTRPGLEAQQSHRVSEVIVAPGNAGTAREHGLRNAEVQASDIDGCCAWREGKHTST